MPKVKTHSGAKKRFKVSKHGVARHKKAGARHLLIGMSSNRGRRLRKFASLNRTDSRTVKFLLPYA